MKNNDSLTTVELMDWIASSLREMNSMDITDRRLPAAINRTKANAAGSQAALKLALFDSKQFTNGSGHKKVALIKEKTNGKVKLLKSE